MEIALSPCFGDAEVSDLEFSTCNVDSCNLAICYLKIILRALAKGGHLLRDGIRNDLLAIPLVEYQSAEVVFGGLVTEPLERNIDAAVQHSARDRHDDSQFLLSDDDSQTIGDIGDQPDHLRGFTLEHVSIDDHSAGPREKTAGFVNRGDDRRL